MQAFEALVVAVQEPVYNLAFRMVQSAADADDVAQEVFVKLHRSIGRFRWRSRFTTWLYALAANTCRSALRKRLRLARFEVACDADTDRRDGAEPIDGAPLPSAALVSRETGDQVNAVIAALPVEFRTVLVLREIQGLDYMQIAQALGCSVGTVKSRLARARLRARDMLRRRGLICAAAAS